MTLHTSIWNGSQTIFSITPSRLSLTIDSSPMPTVVNFDLAGRPWSVMRQGIFHQRCLNGRIIAKWVDARQGRNRRWLSEMEARALEQEIHHLIAELLDGVEAGAIEFDPELDHNALMVLTRVARFTPRSLSADVESFHAIYKPVGILPPDQYQAVLLQATEGCSYNQCTFCAFYKDRRFRIKDAAEFQAHCRDVRGFLGPGLSLRRTIFLGDANALVVPQGRLLRLFSIINETFNVEELGGVFAFQDGFSGRRKDARDYRELRSRGLERVYIGLESGHDPLLQFLEKPGEAADALSTVRALKAAGVGVGVIILLGAGGRAYAEGHVRDTKRVLNQMQLDMNDQIYFSQLVESEGSSYSVNAYQADLQPLSARDRLRQGEQIESGLSFSADGGTPHISRYDIREFVY